MSQQLADTTARGMNDETLLQKARNAANGRKFSALFDEGWESRVIQHTYSERQHAELALVVHLVWWSGHGTEQVSRLFEQSALYREEHEDSPEYLEELIESAESLLGSERYDPNWAGGID